MNAAGRHDVDARLEDAHELVDVGPLRVVDDAVGLSASSASTSSVAVTPRSRCRTARRRRARPCRATTRNNQPTPARGWRGPRRTDRWPTFARRPLARREESFDCGARRHDRNLSSTAWTTHDGPPHWNARRFVGEWAMAANLPNVRRGYRTRPTTTAAPIVRVGPRPHVPRCSARSRRSRSRQPRDRERRARHRHDMQHYFDPRRRARRYAMAFADGVSTWHAHQHRLLAARLRAALHRHVQRRWQHHRREMGELPRRRGPWKLDFPLTSTAGWRTDAKPAERTMKPAAATPLPGGMIDFSSR